MISKNPEFGKQEMPNSDKTIEHKPINIIKSSKEDTKKQELGPEEAAAKDQKELDEFMSKNETEILSRLVTGGEGNLAEELIERHDKGFAPEKMAEIKRDAKAYVEKVPDILEEAISSPYSYEKFAESFGLDPKKDYRGELKDLLERFEEEPELQQ